MRISGIGVLNGGKVQSAKIDGIAWVNGDIDSDSLIVNGKADIKGSVRTGNAEVHGLAQVGSWFEAECCKIEGMLDVEEAMKCREAKVYGSLTVHGCCQAERLISEGKLKLDALSAGEMRMKLDGQSSVRELSAGKVDVSCKGDWLRSGWQKLLSFTKEHRLHAGTIEGEDIYLEHTTASVVRGARVKIGPGCDIGLVQYSEKLELHSQSDIRQTKRF